MKTVQEDREIITGGLIETHDFTIKANGKAFKVLIDGLYSNKVKAVIRELCTNAFDSHIMAGTPDEPFDVFLPTVFEPVFTVRDYGVSLEHNDVMRLYTTIFESTKEDTNTQVGKLGLGSKSPFAYTDTFTVRAWLDGECRTYSAFIGGKYVPQIALLGREPSDEPTGFEVSFPVKDGDLHAFRREAAEVFMGFKVWPKVLGSVIYRPEHTPLFSGDGWAIYADGGSHAIQGCVRYPLNIGSVMGASDKHRALVNYATNLQIEFPIGDLEITASRESLSYDEVTSANIINRLDTVFAAVEVAVIKHFAGLKSAWEVTEKWDVLTDSVLLCAVLKDFVWRGREIDDSLAVNQSHLIDKISRGTDVSKLVHGILHVESVAPSTLKKSQNPRPSSVTYTTRIYPKNTIVYVRFMDGGKLPAARTRALLDARTKNKGCLFIKLGSRKLLGRLLVALGRPPFIDVASLPKPATERYTASSRKAVFTYVEDGQVFCDTVDKLFEEGGYYIPQVRTSFSTHFAADARNVDRTQTINLCRYLVASGALASTDKVFVVFSSDKNRVKGAKWINLFEHARAFLDAQNAYARISEHSLTTDRMREIRYVFPQVSNLSEHTGSLPAGSFAKTTAETFARLNTQSPDVKKLVNVYHATPDRPDLPTVTVPEIDQLRRDCVEFEDRYPLVTDTTSDGQELAKHCAIYIAAIDATKADPVTALSIAA